MRTSAPITANCDGQGQNQPARSVIEPKLCRMTHTAPLGRCAFFCARKKSREKGLHSGVRCAILTTIDI